MAFQPCALKANHHQMRISTSKPIYHYKLELTESNPEKVVEALKLHRPKLFELLSQFMNVNQNVYSPKLAQGTDLGIPLGPLPSDGEVENMVTLKLAGKIDNKNDQSLIISRLFKQVIRNQHGMVSVGNKGQKLFWSARASKFPDQNLEIWPGVEVIFKPGDAPCLVIDCAFKMLRYRTALEELNTTRNPECLVDQIVMTQYNKKFYKVEAVDVNMRPSNTFTNEKGESITFAQYYEMKYKVKVDGNQPLIKATVRGMRDKQEKTVYLVPSLCQLTGLTDQLRNDFNAMKNMATVTKPNADTRIQIAGTFANQLANTEVTNRKTGEKKNIFKEWGIEVNPGCMEVQGKRIHPGSLLMGSGTRLDLADSRTNLDRQTQTQMYSTPQMKLTLVVIFNKRTGEETLRLFMDNYKAAAQEFSFLIFNPPIVRSIDNDREDELEGLTDSIQSEAQQRNTKVNFIIFLFPGQKKKARLYKTAKRISMNKFGCASQVIIERTLAKNTRSIVNKILLQLCAKVGGTPWSIDGLPAQFQNSPTMVCGTDVFAKSKRLNQLAFCSSVDRNISRYYSQVLTSGEFSTHLQPALKAALLAFKDQNGIFPKNILIYRDGVSDGQQDTVLSTELPQYKQALEELELTDSKIVLIICNKRVSAKFYTSPRPENPPSGTCIDSKTVCETAQPNFYLISQITRQGTVTPTLYKILHSDIAGVEDDIKVITFKLCWLFYNFTGPIKIPAPVRYAHCLCNFIGDNYAQNDKIQFLPIADLVKQKVLFYI